MSGSLPIIDVAAVFAAAVRSDGSSGSGSRDVATTTVPDPIDSVRFDVIDGARPGSPIRDVAERLADVCEHVGFFYVIGYPHRQLEVESQLDAALRQFFALPHQEKMEIEMARGGKAWRGFFPVGGELTSGKPDLKEGIYFGEQLDEDSGDDRVRRGLPLHGPNLFPRRPVEVGPLVVEYMQRCAVLGHVLMGLLAAGLGLPARHFADTSLKQHLPLFRAFHYPAAANLAPDLRARADLAKLWGVGEHTDYGLLTLLRQDDVGGLEVRSLDGKSWVPAPPVDGSLVVNIGDTLESMTGGLLRSTPHRVRNTSVDKMRISMPFFFDPGFDCMVGPLPLDDERRARAAAHRRRRAAEGHDRWDKEMEPAVAGKTYGAYLVSKVSRVFPQLATARL